MRASAADVCVRVQCLRACGEFNGFEFIHPFLMRSYVCMMLMWGCGRHKYAENTHASHCVVFAYSSCVCVCVYAVRADRMAANGWMRVRPHGIFRLNSKRWRHGVSHIIHAGEHREQCVCVMENGLYENIFNMTKWWADECRWKSIQVIIIITHNQHRFRHFLINSIQFFFPFSATKHHPEGGEKIEK